MQFLSKCLQYVIDSKYRFKVNTALGLTDYMSDEKFLSQKFFFRMGYELDLKHPKTFNEKLQWLKLYDRNPEYTIMVDKFAVKDWVAKKIGARYLIPTIGVWNRWKEIDFSQFPNRFVLKCTHDSGSTILVADKKDFDYNSAQKKMEKRLKRNFYYGGREWPYKEVLPRIIAEEYLNCETGLVPMDYKVLCFMGKPRLIEVHQNRNSDIHTQDFYDLNWNKTDIQQKGEPNSKVLSPQPITLNEMLRLSEVLAKNMFHLRVDWYEVSGELFFGELTFYDSSGFSPFSRFEDDELLGSWIELGL